MKTATGLVAIAIGAIFAFAVNGHPGFLNLQVVGWIIMLLGIAGLVIPRRGYGWLRRQVVLRRGPDGRPVAVRRRPVTVTPYAIDPAAADAPVVYEPNPDDVTAVQPPVVGEEIVEEYLPE
jgi:hypothetical protein